MDDFEEALERLRKLEIQASNSVEERLAASHKKTIHELRKSWLTTVCKSLFVAFIAAVASIAVINDKHGDKE